MNKYVILLIIGISLLFTILYIRYTRRLQNDNKLSDISDKMYTFLKQDKIWDYPLEKLNDSSVVQNLRIYRGDKSYTINKKTIYLCLKDHNGNYYDNNTLVYVITHELAHVLCDEIGHTEKFHKIFDTLLFELELEGLYDSNIPIAENYCKLGDPDMLLI